MKKTIVICRCEEVTEKEIIAVIKKGYTSLEEIKRILRCGMGHCQGKGCLMLIARILSQMTGQSIEKIKFPTSRPPLKPIPIEVLAKYSTETSRG
ncbi:MAG: (2Fe-2S)-binding protein [candidate division WOR-3 bacterium]|nr:(2Fe-2S)-binding protein [candidate division WOR-3 bacterium]